MNFKLKFVLGNWEICIILERHYNRSLKGEYGSNCIASWLGFVRNIGKIQQLTICVLYKSWPNSYERAVWVNPYYPWFKFFKRCLKQIQNTSFWWKLIKNPWEIDMSRLKIDQNFVKGKYGSNRIVFNDFCCCILVLENRLNSGV